MSEPFLTEIKLVSFNFPPKGWALCNGQFMPINQNQAMFALLGTTYGGNGQTTFALPNLRGRLPLHMGNGHTLGEAAGSRAVTLTSSGMPQHFHVLRGQAEAATANLSDTPLPTPVDKALSNAQVGVPGGGTAALNLYGPAENLVAMSASTAANTGGSQPHNNMMPYLVLNFIIALQGIFPSQN